MASHEEIEAALAILELRAVDAAISDDMLQCLDTPRWGRAALHRLVPDGDQRVPAVIGPWCFLGPLAMANLVLIVLPSNT